MSDERFLHRWSARKRAAQEPEPAPPPARPEPPEPPDLPPLESLKADSDFTPFLAEGVPEALARAALRIAWRSDPVLANLDGLNDYDEDFTIGSTGQVVRTALRVGRKLAERLDSDDPALPPAGEPAPGDDEPPADAG